MMKPLVLLMACQNSVEKGNMGLYVHRNHEGLLGTGKLGGREFLYLTPTRDTVTTKMILHEGAQLYEPFECFINCVGKVTRQSP